MTKKSTILAALTAIVGYLLITSAYADNHLSNGSLNNWLDSAPVGWQISKTLEKSSGVERTSELDAGGAALVRGTGGGASKETSVLAQDFPAVDTSNGFHLGFDFVLHTTLGLKDPFSKPLTVQLYRGGQASPWLELALVTNTPSKGPFSIELSHSVGQSIAQGAFQADVPYHLMVSFDGKEYSLSYYRLGNPTSVTKVTGVSSYFARSDFSELTKLAFIGADNGFTIDNVSLSNTGEMESFTASIVVGSENCLDGPFMGFGSQWDPYQNESLRPNSAEFAEVKKRLSWMKMPITRIMMLANWCYTPALTFDFETPEMKALYRQLDVCQELGMTVLLTEWGYNDTWMKTPGVKGLDDPAYAKITVSYLNHLINVKGYSCIKYLIYVNEGSWFHRENKKAWLTGLSNFSEALKSAGLSEKIRLATTDASVHSFANLDTISWLRDVFPMAAAIGAYELHSYVTVDDMRKNDIYRIFEKAWKQVRTADPDRSKPLIITEAGFSVKNPPLTTIPSASSNSLNADWRYGLYMAEYARQAVDSGTWGVIAWMADDGSHVGFNWGLWMDRKNGMKLKPWSYVWQILTRSFPPGSQFFRTVSDNARVQVMAAKLPAGENASGNRWTLCVVNKGTTEAMAEVQVPGEGNSQVARYVYSESTSTRDGDGFPVPLENMQIELGGKTRVKCPPESVTFLVPVDLAIPSVPQPHDD